MSENPVPPPNPMGNMMASTGYSGPAPTKEECNMAMLVYILAIITGWLGPLIIWLVKKDTSKFVDDQGKEVLNWSITVFIAMIISGVLIVVLIGFILMPIVFLAHLILTIMGMLKAKDGIAYRYPFAIRLLK